MIRRVSPRLVSIFISFGAILGTTACGDEQPLDAGGDGADGGAGGGAGGPRYLLGSVSIDADGNRVSYAQLIEELDGHFTNRDGIEANGNAVFLSHGSDFFYGLAESPEWVRYSTRDGFEETGRLSFAHFGISSMDFNNVIVDGETAVSILTGAYEAVVWNPKEMRIEGTIDLSDMAQDGYDLEAWTVVAHDGLVYVPGRWVNWETLQVKQLVSVTVLDPKKLEVVGVAEDERCGSGGRVTFDSRGYGYVMGDGRNQSMQTFAASRDEPIVPNCLLRMAPGTIAFEEDFFFEMPELTGGLDSMTELEAPSVQSDFAFTMMKYEERIPEDADRLAFAHWDVPAYKTWRISLGDEPKAEVVEGAHFSVVGFGGSGLRGKLYSAESTDGETSVLYEIDPETNRSVEKFTMEGYFAALLPLE